MTQRTKIRRLGAQDLLAMRQMNHMFGQVFEDSKTYEKDPPSDRYLRQRLQDDAFIAVAAQDASGGVIGGLVAYELKKFESQRSEIYLYDLAVYASFRRQGVATAMIQALKQIAGAKGAWVVFVQADLDDEPAIELYTKLGEREDVLHFDIKPS